MFFYLAKILWALLVPTNLLLLLMTAAVVGLYTRAAKASRRALVALLVAFMLSGLGPVGMALLRPLEERFPRPPAAIPAPTGIIVLGGGVDQEISLLRGNVETTEAGDRMVEGALLALRYPEARLVFTGGSGALLETGAREADVARRIFVGLGLSPERLVFEDRSRDTFENAHFVRDLVAAKAGESWLLVTSASHMPRAMGVFRKAGFAVVAYPVDYATTGQIRDFVRPPRAASGGWERTDRAAREYVGLLAYWLSGRTSALFPRP